MVFVMYPFAIYEYICMYLKTTIVCFQRRISGLSVNVLRKFDANVSERKSIISKGLLSAQVIKPNNSIGCANCFPISAFVVYNN